MAIRLVHTTRAQEVRFGDRGTAERYAAEHGGLDVWRLVPAPREANAEERHARVDSPVVQPPDAG